MKVRGERTVHKDGSMSLDIVDKKGNIIKNGMPYPEHQLRKKGFSIYTKFKDKCIFRLTVLSYEGEYEIVCVNPYIKI